MQNWYENPFITGLAPVPQQPTDVQFVGYPDSPDWDLRAATWASALWVERNWYNWKPNHHSSVPYLMRSLLMWNREWYGAPIPEPEDLGAPALTHKIELRKPRAVKLLKN